jgi:hypothetical protein
LRGSKTSDVDKFSGATFEEFVADFSATGKSVAEINKKLLDKGILGGFDLGTASRNSQAACCSVRPNALPPKTSKL